jgi:L-iditol 2-dehydrogenase
VQAVFEKARLSAADYALITGPGTIGLLCMQLVRLFGCRTIVVGTEADSQRLRLATALGADYVVYAKNAEEEVRDIAQGIGATVCFECSGAGAAVRSALRALRKNGHYVQVGLTAAPVSVDLNLVAMREYTIAGSFAQKPVWWDTAIDLAASGKVRLAPMAEHTHDLEDWETAFAQVMNGVGFKHILTP